MKRIIFALFVFAGVSVRAESPYQVDLLSPSREYLFVDRAWQRNADCIEAKVSVASDTPGDGLVVKAYFYNGDNKLMHTEMRPTSRADDNGGTEKFPAELKSGKKYSFFFGIVDKLKTGPNKWKRAVVVFGKGDSFSAKTYPKDDLAKFDFPEKSNVR